MVGLEVYSGPAGSEQVIFSTDYPLVVGFLGVVDVSSPGVNTSITSPASGSFTDTRLIGKTLFYFTLSTESTLSFFGGPNVTLNPDTGVVSWSYNNRFVGTVGGSYMRHRIVYGGY